MAIIPLTVYQTGSNKSEATRIRAEHPGEDDAVRDGRVLAIVVTRALGDHAFLWE